METTRYEIPTTIHIRKSRKSQQPGNNSEMNLVSSLPARSLPGDQLTSKTNLKLIELSNPYAIQKALEGAEKQ
ncbi:unnamed protein product [Penicillium camemberti]|uniref:Str. FM013 n=1 Tax=Penicillium camemberti (strain FM 013) TaxID=1429867 RepID=A0A0G4NZ29_PENC3|nr:unnamed protein product [Penicillium camemberti]